MRFRIALGPVSLALFLACLAHPAGAATFDFIYADRLEVTTYPSNVGFTLAGSDIGLVVNKGLANIEGPEFFGATFTSTSSNPSVSAYPFINNPGPPVTPVLPNQAVGSVQADNAVLTTLLLPGETHNNTAPLQVISIQVNYPPGFSGSVAFNITLTMGAERADYTIIANFTLGSDFDLAFPSAARVHSVPLATPASVTSWGALKKLYR